MQDPRPPRARPPTVTHGRRKLPSVIDAIRRSGFMVVLSPRSLELTRRSNAADPQPSSPCEPMAESRPARGVRATPKAGPISQPVEKCNEVITRGQASLWRFCLASTVSARKNPRGWSHGLRGGCARGFDKRGDCYCFTNTIQGAAPSLEYAKRFSPSTFIRSENSSAPGCSSTNASPRAI